VAYTVPQLKDFSPAALDKAVEKLLSALDQESAALADEAQRKTFRDHWLARKDGILTQINELWLKPAPKEAKREVGQRVNKLKAEVESKVEAALAQASSAKAESAIDVSLPGIRRPIGAESCLHTNVFIYSDGQTRRSADTDTMTSYVFPLCGKIYHVALGELEILK